jgi:lipopolysaccharide transport system permease protein
VIELKKRVDAGPKDKVYDVDLTYLTSRGYWYYTSWKGDITKSGGIATNIGVHFFDMLFWIFGDLKENVVHLHEHDRAAGYLELERARVRWFLSINYDVIPEHIKATGARTYRSLQIEGQEFEFSGGFTELHTRLGPLWYFLQPLFTTIIFTVVFSKLAGISTDGMPPMLFYLAGITNWNYFSDCLGKTATTFRDNQNIFGKVYFPRLVVPLSIVLSNLIRYGIQLIMFAGFYVYFVLQGAPVGINAYVLLFPLLVLLLAALGLGFGLMITSLTTKYRDLIFLLKFGIQLFMYATPVIYPLSVVPEDWRWLAILNPMASIIETFKYGFLGEGTFAWELPGLQYGLYTCTPTPGHHRIQPDGEGFMDVV